MLTFCAWTLLLIFAASLSGSLLGAGVPDRPAPKPRAAYAAVVVAVAAAQVFASWTLYDLHRAALDAAADKEVGVVDPRK